MSTYRKLLFAALGTLLSVSPVFAQYQQPVGPPSGPAPAREPVAPLAPDGTLGMALLSAAVNTNGTLARGSGVTSTTNLAVGLYQIIFDRNVTQCVYVATIGDPGPGAAGPGQIDVAQLGNNARGVFLRTSNSAGAVTNLSFHLLVFCNK